MLDALYRGVTKPGIFTQDDFKHFEELFANAIEEFEVAHENTYMGRNNVMRRFVNRQK